MAEIFGFEGKKQNPVNLNLVQGLEQLLEMAKSGEIQSMVGLAKRLDGDIVTAWVTTSKPNYFELLGMGQHLCTMIQKRIE